MNVVNITVTDNYDGTNLVSTRDILVEMRSINRGFPHSPGIDLHHALLGRGPSGGIAYVGKVCNSDVGFGVTADVKGTISSIGSSMYWDLFVFAHEVG